MTELDDMELKKLQRDFLKLKKEMTNLVQNFSNRIVFSKMIEIKGSGKLKLRSLSSNPTSGKIGELVVVNGVLKICTATTPTWTVVGTQT